MTKAEQEIALRLLSERLCTSHHWRDARHIAAPFGPQQIKEHLAGAHRFGLCPIDQGQSTTSVAVLDLDSHKGETPWPVMVETAQSVAFMLEQNGAAPVLFKSSGGKGIHIYLLWHAPMDAHSVRHWLHSMLAECGYKPGVGGVAVGEIEIFPKQDSVPADGFGSMFVLPFSGASEPLQEFTHWPESGPIPFIAKPERIEPALKLSTTTPAALARLQSALAAIPNEGEGLDYDSYRNIIFGIHHASGGSAEGLALAHEFSARSTKYDGHFLDAEIWPYIRSERDGAVITDRTIYSRAGAAGWRDPALIEDFEDVEPINGAEHPALKPERYEFVPAEQFTTGKQPGWIVKDVLPAAELAVVYGESASGKTFFVLDLAIAVTRGGTWRGHRVRQGRVGYIAAEGAGGFRGRVKAYQQHHDAAALDLWVLADAPNFLLKDDITEVARAMKRAGPMSLVVVDTLAQVTPGGNENSGEDVGKVIGFCRLIHRYTGALVLLIHHSGKDASKGARGWSGLRAAADAEIEIVRNDHDRVATVTKLKDGGDFAEFGFRLLQVPIGLDEDGDTVTSCVVEYTASTGRVKKPKGRKQALVRQIIIDLQSIGGDGLTVDSVMAEYMLRVPKGEGRDQRRSHFLRELRGLEDDGLVSSEGGFVKLVGEGERA